MSNLISKQATAEIVGLHPEHVMRMVREDRFPKPIRLGPSQRHTVRFLESEVHDWINGKIMARDETPIMGKAMEANDVRK